MPGWLEAVSLGEAAALGAFLLAVVAVLRKVVPGVRKAARLVDDVVGAPGHPGVMDRLAALEKQVGQAANSAGQAADSAGAAAVQLYRNGGSSARDQIDALAKGQAEILQQLKDMRGNP
ncbi:MAG TPA: hypothetical protein VLL08_12665 [Kineosporiaceae bacterium]|nr:hypothetical protein [Kineosporiaceae bacterium]